MTEEEPDAASVVNDAMKSRGVEMLPCDVCGEKDSFTLIDGYHLAAIAPNSKHHVLGGKNMPLLPICCTKCGNTKFLNSLILGIGGDIFRTQNEQPKS